MNQKSFREQWFLESNAVGMNKETYYSERYYDDAYEYRSFLACLTRSHVILSDEQAAKLPKDRLLSEEEWRKLGVQQSRGWVHYDIHKPEPHVLLFRRPLNSK